MTTSTESTLTVGAWPLDTAHSSVEFTIRHLGIAKVRGRFNKFDAGFVVGADGFADIEATIHLDSIDTGNADRDAHVKTADFLDVANRPTLTWRATEPVRIAENFEVTGHVTIGDQVKPVKLDVEWGGIEQFPGGDRHAGFSAVGKIKRSDFGVGSGFGGMLSDDLKIELEIQLIEPK